MVYTSILSGIHGSIAKMFICLPCKGHIQIKYFCIWSNGFVHSVPDPKSVIYIKWYIKGYGSIANMFICFKGSYLCLLLVKWFCPFCHWFIPKNIYRVVAGLVTRAFCAEIYILASGMQGHGSIAHISFCLSGDMWCVFWLYAFGHYVTGLFNAKNPIQQSGRSAGYLCILCGDIHPSEWYAGAWVDCTYIYLFSRGIRDTFFDYMFWPLCHWFIHTHTHTHTHTQTG